MKMTSRERIVEVINHRQTDILPIDFGAMRSTGISIIAYDQLRKYLNIDIGLPKMYDVFQQLAEPDEEILNLLGGDVVQAHRLSPAFGCSIKKWRKMTLASGFDCLVPENYNPRINQDGSQDIIEGNTVIAHMPSGGLYFDSTVFPMSHIESFDDIDAITFPQMTDEELDFIENEVKNLYQSTNRAILFAFGGNILEAGESYWGFEKFFEYMLTEPELVQYWCEKLTKTYLYDLEKIMPRISNYINIIQFGDDLGTQQSMLISKNTYREMIKPYHQKLYSYIQNNYSNVKVFLHSCGAISELIPDLIEAGVQILNPVQISASGMNPIELKKKYGNNLVFWGGGSNMQKTALIGTINEIKAETRELIEIFSQGGGYVFNQVHNIQANVTPERVLAIYNTALEFRKEQMLNY
jgi:uroporphyrinogen decarboxylase